MMNLYKCSDFDGDMFYHIGKNKYLVDLELRGDIRWYKLIKENLTRNQIEVLLELGIATIMRGDD